MEDLRMRVSWLIVTVALAGCSLEPEPSVQEPAEEAYEPASQDAPEPPAGDARPNADGLTWTAPEGWTDAGARTMRVANYSFGDGGECYVTVLNGDGGGMVANIGRWYGQMGQAAPSADDFAGLTRIQVLGVAAPLVDVRGSFTGMSGDTISDARMLGVVAELAEQAVFVKMIGPADDVKGQMDAFVEFCQSLK